MATFECGLCGKVSHAKPCDCHREFQIHEISNYYGTLTVGKTDGRCWWMIDNYCPSDESEIPESLYQELLKLHASKDKHAT